MTWPQLRLLENDQVSAQASPHALLAEVQAKAAAAQVEPEQLDHLQVNLQSYLEDPLETMDQAEHWCMCLQPALSEAALPCAGWTTDLCRDEDMYADLPELAELGNVGRLPTRAPAERPAEVQLVVSVRAGLLSTCRLPLPGPALTSHACRWPSLLGWPGQQLLASQART